MKFTIFMEGQSQISILFSEKGFSTVNEYYKIVIFVFSIRYPGLLLHVHVLFSPWWSQICMVKRKS
uniref:Uncharacterized protein n=1 Tax=Rhizophora mucronata TaxID=61149 RepID=A0A2P2NT67_RHIMU